MIMIRCYMQPSLRTSEGVGLDHITRAFKVESTQAWDTTAHGYVLLPEIHEVK